MRGAKFFFIEFYQISIEFENTRNMEVYTFD